MLPSAQLNNYNLADGISGAFPWFDVVATSYDWLIAFVKDDSLRNLLVYNILLNANLNIKVCSSILVGMINFCRLLRCYMVHFRLERNGYVETVSFQLSA